MNNQITIKEAGQRYGLPTSTIRVWMKNGTVSVFDYRGEQQPGLNPVRLALREHEVLNALKIYKPNNWRERKASVMEKLATLDVSCRVSRNKAARLTGLNVKTIMGALHNGELRHALVNRRNGQPGKYLITIADLIEWARDFDCK